MSGVWRASQRVWVHSRRRQALTSQLNTYSAVISLWVYLLEKTLDKVQFFANVSKNDLLFSLIKQQRHWQWLFFLSCNIDEFELRQPKILIIVHILCYCAERLNCERFQASWVGLSNTHNDFKLLGLLFRTHMYSCLHFLHGGDLRSENYWEQRLMQ